MEPYTVDVSPRDNVVGDIALYIFESRDGLILVEAGPSNGLDRLRRFLAKKGYTLRDIKHILLTHIHLDHGGGAGYIVEENPDVKVYVHPRGAQHLVDPGKLWKSSRDTIGEVADIYGKPIPVPEDAIVTPEDGVLIDIGGYRFRFIYTPGHATHHMSIHSIDSGILFTGDSAGLYHGGTVIPTTPPPHNVEKSLESIRKMTRLHPRKIGFTHYGVAEDGLEWLHRYEVIYRKWVRLVEEAYRAGRGIEEVYQYLQSTDLSVAIQERFFRERGYGEAEILLSLYGIYSYFRWLDERA